MDTLNPKSDTSNPKEKFGRSPLIEFLMPLAKAINRANFNLLKNKGEVDPPPVVDPPPAQDPPVDPPPVVDPPVVTDPPPVDPPVVKDPPPGVKNWYDGMSEDLRNNPTVQKYKTNEDQVKAHLELQSLLGHEKIALPKDENDTAAIKNFNKAVGVPEEVSGYELTVPTVEGMEGVEFGLDEFKAKMHSRHVPQKMAQGILEDYTGMIGQMKAQAMTAHIESVNKAKSELTGEWGMSYDSKVKLGQQVMNKFSGSKENFDHINALIGADPVALKWLATVGEQFSEGSLGDIGDPKVGFTKTPADAKAEYDTIMSDPEDIYWAGVRNKKVVAESVRKERVAYVESLLQMQQGNAVPAP